MGMDERDVQQLQQEVGEVDLHDPVVRAWLVEGLREQRVLLTRQQAHFRLQRMLRDDEGMRKVSGQVERIRKAIAALEAMLAGEPHGCPPTEPLTQMPEAEVEEGPSDNHAEAVAATARRRRAK